MFPLISLQIEAALQIHTAALVQSLRTGWGSDVGGGDAPGRVIQLEILFGPVSASFVGFLARRLAVANRQRRRTDSVTQNAICNSHTDLAQKFD